MDKRDFELNVWLTPEPMYAGTLRELAAHAARYAGCEPHEADRYAAAVEQVLLACIARTQAGTVVPVVLRRAGGPLECLVGCEGGVEASEHERVSVSWTREGGSLMCRVAVDL